MSDIKHCDTYRSQLTSTWQVQLTTLTMAASHLGVPLHFAIINVIGYTHAFFLQMSVYYEVEGG